MSRVRKQIWIEVQGNTVIAWQGSKRVCLQTGGNTTKPQLPTASSVQHLLAANGFSGKHCILLLPRDHWVVGMDLYSAMRGKELQQAAQLAADTAAASFDEPAYSVSTWIQAKESRIYWAVITKSCVQQYADWLQDCNLELQDLNLPAFSYLNIACDGMCLLLVGYPEGWELRWFTNGVLTNLYASLASHGDELCQALSMMTLAAILPEEMGKVDQWPDTLNIPTTPFHITLLSSGTIPSPLQTGIEDWQEAIQSVGVELTVKQQVVPGIAMGEVQWPSFAALSTNRKTTFPSLKLQSRETKQSQQPFRLTFAVIAMVVLITLGLTGSSWWLQHRNEQLQQELVVLSQPLHGLLATQDALNQLSHEAQFGIDFYRQQDQILQVLLELDKRLPQGSQVEWITLESDQLDFVLFTPSVTRALGSLEQSTQIAKVSLATSITRTSQAGSPGERVGLKAQLLPLGGDLY